MLSYPADLDPQEQQRAEARLRELAERFTADGTLRSRHWREVFTRTWRHPYVPSFYPDLTAPCLLSIDPQRFNSDGTATGRFLPHWAGFMWLRHTPDIPLPKPPLWLDDEPVESVTPLDPTLISSDGLVGFVAQWHLPDVTWGPATENGTAGIQLWAPDGSRASVRSIPITGGFPVSQTGPQRLWNRVEEAYAFWQCAGRPHYDQFGITVTPTGQYVWYDRPDGEYRWPLPTSTGRQR